MKKVSSILAIFFLVGTAAAFANGQAETSSGSAAPDYTGPMGMKANMSLVEPADPSQYNLENLGPSIVPFTTEADAQALAATGPTIYFFAATWCPHCQATYKDIQANYKMIPSNVHLIFVDYDKANALKEKYGITMQHTFVLIDPTGAKKKIWVGTETVASILKSAGISS
ncbi:MAG: thioredoxin family protein [Spirochaetales bacterium]|nr:thioredoxin family protein [Spirochaetales bacterium]